MGVCVCEFVFCPVYMYLFMLLLCIFYTTAFLHLTVSLHRCGMFKFHCAGYNGQIIPDTLNWENTGVRDEIGL